jgi:hypothetical protein
LKVRFLKSLASTNSSYAESEVADLPAPWATALLSAGTVERVDETATIGLNRETLTAGGGREKAVAPKGQNRKAR